MLETIAQFIRNNRTFLIATHISPDADAIGSAVALKLGLEALGKTATVCCASPVPEKFAIIDPSLAGRLALPTNGPYDCAIVVDLSSKARLPQQLFTEPIVTNQQILIIDHHDSETDFPFVAEYKRPEAPACAMLVYEVLQSLGVPCGPRIATAIYAGIAGDTDHFTNSGTNAHAFQVAAAMVSHGANPPDIASALNKQPLAYYRLLGQVAPTFTVTGRVAWGFCRRADWQQYPEVDADAVAEFIGEVERIRGPEAFVFGVEQPNGGLRVRLRSAVHNVRHVAEKWGGGGHDQAAGIRLSPPLDVQTTMAQIVEDLNAAI